MLAPTSSNTPLRTTMPVLGTIVSRTLSNKLARRSGQCRRPEAELRAGAAGTDTASTRVDSEQQQRMGDLRGT
jgi:hypothetical protein